MQSCRAMWHELSNTGDPSTIAPLPFLVTLVILII
jgi:hypothetical protein